MSVSHLLSKLNIISIIISISNSELTYGPTKFQIIGQGGWSAIEDILRIHNNFRNMAKEGSIPNQPRAKELCLLEWDFSLAVEAQKIANTCDFAHKKVTNTEFAKVGQSLYLSTHSRNIPNPNWTEAITAWFVEHKKYYYPNGPDLNSGHYTQIVWNTTKYVGCAYTYFNMGNITKMPYCRYYVCNYGPGGNIVGFPPYEESTEDEGILGYIF